MMQTTRTSTSRTSRRSLIAIAVASLASLATSEILPEWTVSEDVVLEGCISAAGDPTYLVETSVHVPADASIWSVSLDVEVEGTSEDAAPLLTIDLEQADTGQSIATSTRRGEDGRVAAQLRYQLLESDSCDFPESGDARCEDAFVVTLRGDADLELDARITLSAAGYKEAEDDPDPDVTVDLRVRCADEEES
jgi:hypothetical protein